jgi:hypothetical protein
MSPRKTTAFRPQTRWPMKSLATYLLSLVIIGAFALIFASGSVQAKETSVTAIALFDGPSGPAYVQLTGLTLNGKTELRVCDDVPKMDRGAYDNLLRIQLSGATSLERGADGVLRLTVESKPICVVPSNLKFEKNAVLTPAQAADQAALQGVTVSSSIPGSDPPAFKPGVRIVLVAAPDIELAEYLVAERARSIKVWQGFLQRYGSSSRAAEAKNVLAALYEESAESAFADYQRSATAHANNIGLLKQAEQQLEQALKTVPGYPPANKLRIQINKELEALLEPDRGRVQAFRKALDEHTAGYQQLVAARQHNDQVLEVNRDYTPALNLHNDIASEEHKLDLKLQDAEALLVAKQYDDALATLGPYRSFAAEQPRINSVVMAAYSSHFNRGQQLAGQQDWEHATAEFRKAVEIRSDSKEADAALRNAELQLTGARNRQAVNLAIQESRDYAEKSQFIEAYNVLAELPEAQRALVKDQLLALRRDYVASATRRAQKLQEIHIPIRGRADEDAVREAYELLNRASSLGADPGMKLKLDLLSDKISSYYFGQARRYLEKPLGSGVGIGWLYLDQAQRYKPNLDSVKDEMARYAPANQMRAQLSIGVVLRDQTSRRESLGFADQLADAIATGMESSGLSVKVVRQPKEGPDTVPPFFLLVGEILQHRVVKDTNLETLQSKYRAGTHDVKNEAWLKANSDYDAAQKALQSAQRALADAQAQHNKKDAAAASDAITAAQKNMDDARHRLDTTEASRAQDVIEPYNYTKRSISLTAVIELAFRITDQAGNAIGPSVPVQKDNHKTVVVLDNVKPEDTEGIKKQSIEPDEIQFLADLEIQARDLLVKSVREKVLLLPQKILQEARSRAQRNDQDGAAEEYIVYLNATPDTPSAERDEAAKFLRDHFNVAVARRPHP